MSMGLLYLFVKLDALNMSFGTIAVLVIISLVLYAIFGAIYGGTEYSQPDWSDPDDLDTKYWKMYKKIIFRYLVPILVVSSLLSVFIPTTKEMAFIYIVSKITKDEKAKQLGEKALQLPDKALDLLNAKMNEYLNEQANKDIEK